MKPIGKLAGPITGAFAALLISAPLSAQTFSVRDLECRARSVATCAVIAFKDKCKASGSILCDSIPVPPTMPPDLIASCTARVEATEPDTCLVKIDLGAILSEMRETNRAIQETNRTIRDDQRAMINQLCRSLSSQPDRCDETMPAPKP